MNVTILDALDHPKLFGPHFAAPSWRPWRTFLKALFALPTDDADLGLYRSGAGMAPTIETFRSEGAACSSLPRPQRPSCRADQNASTEWPSAETQPAPVTTIGSCSTAASFKTERVTQLNKVRDSLIAVPGLDRIHRYGHVILVFNRHDDLDQIERRHAQFGQDRLPLERRLICVS